MKKFLKIFLVVIGFIIITGCTKDSESKVFQKISKKIEKLDSYSLKGELEIINNEDTYLYDVDVLFGFKDNFKVSLRNQSNNHEQVILKNKDGVYVITPSLNKSFKFQSEWPYNNSQSYLLQTILKDIKNDKEKSFKVTDESYIYTVKANYSNNDKLVKQNIYFDKNFDLKKVEVLNDKDEVLLKMTISDINYNKNISEDDFTLKESMRTNSDNESTTTTGKIEDIVYPMYLPVNTYLESEDKVKTVNGERVILTFGGDSSFMFIQENAKASDNFESTLVNGELELLNDSIGIVQDNSVNWYSNDREYYVVSDNLSEEELVSIARSISVMAVGK